MDLAFPEKQGAVEYLAQLSLEEFSREVQGVRSCSWGKRLKSTFRKLGYGMRREVRHRPMLNVQSPAALLCICRRYPAESAMDLNEFAERLYSTSSLPRLVHFEDASTLIAKLSMHDLTASLIESVMQVTSLISANVNKLTDSARALADGIMGAQSMNEACFQARVHALLQPVAEGMHLTELGDGALTRDQAYKLFTQAEVAAETQCLNESWEGLLPWLHAHISDDSWERLVQWLQLHMQHLERVAVAADEVLPCIPYVLGLKRVMWDRDIISATRPVAVRFMLSILLASFPASASASTTPCLIVSLVSSIALTSLCRMLPESARSSMLHGSKS